jgi:hypothetical protein
MADRFTGWPSEQDGTDVAMSSPERVAAAREAFAAARIRPPDTFIVGAPKCGTTALWAALGRHPRTVMAGKEPHYFGSDLKIRGRITPEGYVQLFGGAGASEEEPVRVGEASVWYLASSAAAEEIHAFAADARIFILLRDPVDMVASLHGELLRIGAEDIRDLGEAIEAEPDRRRGERIRPDVRFQRQLLYTDAAAYAPMVARYLDTFGPDAVRVMLLDDLRADPQGCMLGAQSFLGLEPDASVVLERQNESARVRNLAVQRAIVRPPSGVRKVIRRVVPRAAIRRVQGALLRVNTTEGSRPELMDPALRAMLVERFRPGVLELQELLGRDLGEWPTLKEASA